MKVQKYAQSTLVFQNQLGRRMLIDPGKYNFFGGFGVGDFGSVDVLVITHKHEDHFYLDAVKSIVGLYHPIVLTNPEVAMVLQKEMIGSTVVQVGDVCEIMGFTLTFVRTDHVVRDEFIINFGLVIEADQKRVYYTSDTRLIDPSLLSTEKVLEPDVLFVPISDRGVVMSIDDALYFASEIRPKVVVPIHYDSPKDKDRIRPEDFINRFNTLKIFLKQLSNIEVRVLSFGEEMDLR